LDGAWNGTFCKIFCQRGQRRIGEMVEGQFIQNMAKSPQKGIKSQNEIDLKFLILD